MAPLLQSGDPTMDLVARDVWYYAEPRNTYIADSQNLASEERESYNGGTGEELNLRPSGF